MITQTHESVVVPSALRLQISQRLKACMSPSHPRANTNSHMMPGTAAFERSCQVASTSAAAYPTVEDYVGKTPLVRLQRLNPNPSNVILLKLEGNNPAGSVKDRPAISMIQEAENAGQIKPGDTLIEATSGNTGIALAMSAAIKGYKLKLIMPSNMTEERRAAMAAYGAELINVPAGKMEMARDLALEMQEKGEGKVLDQFSNQSNPLAHYKGTGPELWDQTNGNITHFVSSMGTTGTIMGTSRFLKEKRSSIQIVGLQPSDGSSIAGIRRWPQEYLPKIFDESRVDTVMEISEREADETMRALAKIEGVFAGVSSGGAVSAAIRLSSKVNDATICVIVCDRGDRYLSSADIDESGQPWCPDCAQMLDSTRSRVREAGGTLMEVQVGSRPEWKDKYHPFREDADLKLTGIPTVIHWTKDGSGERISSQLEQAKTPEEAHALVSEFISNLCQ